MDEILALQRELAAVQESSSPSRLSERNCVELVMKLQALSLVKLIFSRTGKEYLTPRQLEREIQDEIFVRGGRVNVIELPDALNVDLVHVETVLPAVLSELPNNARLVNGEIVTDDYLTSLAEDIEIFLDQSPVGIDDVGQIASRTNLPVELVRSCVLSHIGSTIRATLDASSGVLTSYRARARARASSLGALRAVSSPVLLSDLADQHKIAISVVTDTAVELMAHGLTRGRLDGHGNRARFIPEVYESASIAMAKSLFASNGFITADTLRSLCISNVKGFTQQYLTHARVLGDVIVGSSLLETLESSSSEAVENCSWLDLEAALPVEFPSEHLEDLISLLSGHQDHANSESSKVGEKNSCKLPKSSKRRPVKTSSVDASTTFDNTNNSARVILHGKRLGSVDGVILRAQFIASRVLCERCFDCLELDAKHRAQVRAAKMMELMTVVGQNRPSSGVAEAHLHTVEKGSNAAGKGKTRRRKDKTGGAAFVSNSSGSSRAFAVPIDVPSVESMTKVVAENENIAATLACDYMGNEILDTADLVSAILEEGLGGYSKLRLMYETIAETAVTDMEREQAASRLERERQILEELEVAEVYNINAETLSAVEPGIAESSRQQVLRTVCSRTALRVLEMIALNVGIPVSIPTSESQYEDHQALLDAISERVEILPQDIVSKTRGFVLCVTNRSASNIVEFMQAYDDITATFDLPERRAVDKKRERARNTSLRAILEEMLTQGNIVSKSARECLQICTVLLHARCSGGAIVSPAPFDILKLCDHLLREAKPDAVRRPLEELRSSVGIQPDQQQSEDDQNPISDQELLLRVEALKPFIVANQDELRSGNS